MRDIGKNIRQIRVDRKMTQEELADALFVTRQTVSNYETGKSRPDIETLMLIASVLRVDANTILYGPPQSDEQKKGIRWLCISGGTLLVFAVAYAVLYPICRELKTYLITVPHLLLQMVIRPALLFALGWFLLHLFGILLQLKPVYGKKIRTIRIIVLCTIGIVVVLPIPFLIWFIVGMVESMTSTSVNMSFPNIPVYSTVTNWIMYVHLHLPFMSVAAGAVCQLLGIPHDMRKNKKESDPNHLPN